jgi:hypothetical protein
MNLIEIAKKFPTEESCIAYFRAEKEKKGIVCKGCGSTEFYWSKIYKSHDCKQCHYRNSLRSGTVMESSNLPFHYWLYAMFLMTMTKKGISALELQRQLGHKRYEPIWAMAHKIRAAMGNRDDNYEFDGVVEIDDAFFKTHTNEEDKDKPKKRGRGSQGQTTVLVMAKVEPKVGRPKNHKKSSSFRFVKMVVIPDSSSETINESIALMTNSQTTAKTDGWRGFARIREVSGKHVKKIVPSKEASKDLPWVHTMISNAKRNFLGINHNIKTDYLQGYLDEFCYKVNRRFFGQDLFDRLVGISLEDTWYGKKKYNYG